MQSTTTAKIPLTASTPLTTSTPLTATTAYIKNPEHFINVKNGLLDLTSMKLISHPLEFSSLPKLPKLDVSYAPTATCPVFDRFLDDVCDVYSNSDADTASKVSTAITADMANTASKVVTADTASCKKVLKEARKLFLLEFMGAIFSNVPASRFNKRVLFIYGPNDTGKTQFKRLVEEMLGHSNFSILGAECPLSKMRRALAGRRLSGSGDMSKAEFRWLCKALRESDKGDKGAKGADAGADAGAGVRAGGSASNSDEASNSNSYLGFDGFWWFNMNPRPNLGSLSKSEQAAIAIFEFPNVVPVERRDCRILDKMLAERDGIFLKAVRAFRAISAFRVSSAMKAMKDSNKEEFFNFHVAG